MSATNPAHPVEKVGAAGPLLASAWAATSSSRATCPRFPPNWSFMLGEIASTPCGHLTGTYLSVLQASMAEVIYEGSYVLGGIYMSKASRPR